MRALLLAAGLGTRLEKLTNDLPKCLMPIGMQPLLAYWINSLRDIKVQQILINTHHHANLVENFIQSLNLGTFILLNNEKKLLGTAGTIRKNANFFNNETALVIHADNWCQCNFNAFIEFHKKNRPSQCLITMMTFDCQFPELSGIVDLDDEGVVMQIHEKVKGTKSILANGAIYLLEPEVLEWIIQNPQVKDFSTEVLPHFLGRISSWHNTNILRDIGSWRGLNHAQSDPKPKLPNNVPPHIIDLMNSVLKQIRYLNYE